MFRLGRILLGVGLRLLGGSGASMTTGPLRLSQVVGYNNRSNDIIYCHPASRLDQPSTIVFFGGDVQDYPENMKSHIENKAYVRWNLESTAEHLHRIFPHFYIVVVKPSRMELKTFSCFENFVPCDRFGAPDHVPFHNSLQHLELLLKEISRRLRVMADDPHLSSIEPEPNTIDRVENCAIFKENTHLDETDLYLVGFSKGCVVLNQFLYEFHFLRTLTPDDEVASKFVVRIKEMFWLDGGHGGGKNTWITSRSLLETLSRLGIKVNIHVTPYQVRDDNRPHIKKEEKAFYDILHSLGSPLERVLHFESDPRSLHKHFQVLEAAFQPNNSLGSIT